MSLPVAGNVPELVPFYPCFGVTTRTNLSRSGLTTLPQERRQKPRKNRGYWREFAAIFVELQK